MYSFNDFLYVKDNFNFTLAETKAAPYHLSSTLSEYYGDGALEFNMTDCAGSDTVEWRGNLIDELWWKKPSYNHSYPDPVLNLQFDGQTANLTVDGYYLAEPKPTGKSTFGTANVEVPGKMKISFLGRIDSYHSDVLVNDSSTPTWKRSVGFNNNTLNVGDTTSRGAPSQRSGSWGIALGALICFATYI